MENGSLASSTGAAPGAAALPIFYRRPMPLSPQRHSGLALAPPGDCRFAREANAIPLTLGEFALAARHYPIVFAGTAPAVPVAVVGIGAGSRNLFVDGAGKWRAGAYVPAYVRRYPFLFIEDEGRKELALGIDEGAGLLQEREGAEGKLFWEGKPTALVDQALAFCSEYQANVAATRQFCAALDEARLLSDKEAGVTLKDGRQFRLTGFRVIEEATFDKLPGKALLRLRRRRFLHPIYLHLLSMASWATLVDLAAEQGA